MNRLRNLTDLKRFAETFIDSHLKGEVIALKGDLGVGKTAFVRQVVEILSTRANQKMPRVTSPSFTILQSYPTVPPVLHLDLYRLDTVKSSDLLETGYFEESERIIAEQGYVFVEWAERTNEIQWDTVINFQFDGEDRIANISRQ